MYCHENSLFYFSEWVIDRENKSELKKLREAMERLEGEHSGIIDI
tara:strand:- start:196 stop:330 length:135 start_codon:yes stop_codon:yes gene_type:complete